MHVERVQTSGALMVLLRKTAVLVVLAKLFDAEQRINLFSGDRHFYVVTDDHLPLLDLTGSLFREYQILTSSSLFKATSFSLDFGATIMASGNPPRQWLSLRASVRVSVPRWAMSVHLDAGPLGRR